ncbi:hypothetical protein LTR85_000702 [Meristemomyces frigidus]|nr:hypothetical protein LTR85_000702 [Meristemomyces frigidus]
MATSWVQTGSLPTTARQFSWPPLGEGEIRLIRIPLTAAYHGIFDCGLEVITADEIDSKKYAYQALSYAWGDTTPTRKIICNGQPLWIHQNLYDALLAVCESYRSNPRNSDRYYLATSDIRPGFRLWTDRICIDQSNPVEKAVQIMRMGSIYGRAEGLIVWLGHSRLAYRIAAILSNIQKDGSTHSRKSDPLATVIGEASEDMRVFLAETSWFRRRWVVQELLNVAPKDRWFMWGEYARPYSELYKAVKHCRLLEQAGCLRHGGWRSSGTYAGTMSRKTFATDEPEAYPAEIEHILVPKVSLLENLHRFRAAECSLQHDRIFSLLSISDDDIPQGLIDYKESVDTLYLAVALIPNSTAERRIVSTFVGQTVIVVTVQTIAYTAFERSSFAKQRSWATEL